MLTPISDYANRREKSAANRSVVLLGFMRHVTKTLALQIEDAEAAAVEYFARPKEEQKKLIISYIKYLTKTKTPGTVNIYAAMIRDWHKKNKVLFDDSDNDDIKQAIPPNYSITEDEALTVEKIRAILSHSDAMLRAFILVACSSGARIGEILSLQPGDIEYLEEYGVYSFRMSFRKTKAAKPHRYFISAEAKQAVDDYMRVRHMFISSRAIKTTSCLKHSAHTDNRLFVLAPNSVRYKLDGATKKAGLYSIDSESNRARIHPHSFRKFADTQFKEIVGLNMGNELIGHDEGLSKSYRRYDLRQLAEGYRKIEPFVTIQAPADYVEVKTHIGGEVDKIRASLAAQSLEMAEMKQRLEHTELMLEIARKHNNQ